MQIPVSHNWLTTQKAQIFIYTAVSGPNLTKVPQTLSHFNYFSQPWHDFRHKNQEILSAAYRIPNSAFTNLRSNLRTEPRATSSALLYVGVLLPQQKLIKS
jgi:hypothetical protein